MDDMDTSSTTGSGSEKLSEGEELAVGMDGKGDNMMNLDTPMQGPGSPPLFTPIASTSAMIASSEASVDQMLTGGPSSTAQQLLLEQAEMWTTVKKDFMDGMYSV
jgi:hypothetical protein